MRELSLKMLRGDHPYLVLASLVVLGLAIRLALIERPGFATDIGTFQAWAVALAERGFQDFYAKSYFADYPPGYCYIQIVIGWVWEAFFRVSDPRLMALTALIKLPAILADLAGGVVLYFNARRFANANWALATTAAYILNPAVIENSAIYGQVDSLSGGFAFLGAYLLLLSHDYEKRRAAILIVAAWLSLAYSLLIKPQAAVVLPVFIAFAFQRSSKRPDRLIATGSGIVLSALLAISISEPFHPANPLESMRWLLDRYAFGSGVYAFNSVNAFNLWAISGHFWEPDNVQVLFLPISLWGVALVAAVVGLCVWRYLRSSSERAFLEACTISALAFFCLATRMHERYIFDGLLFTVACIPIARRYLLGAILFSIVLFANLQYALQYLYVMTNHVPNIDTTNLWGLGTMFLSLLAVATFFLLGYQFVCVGPRNVDAA